jgi:hypothetical protein
MSVSTARRHRAPHLTPLSRLAWTTLLAADHRHRRLLRARRERPRGCGAAEQRYKVASM